ncbi:SH3 domain-containing protein [Actinidia chinensis var. chinensis]|uniref:SH3 domain-containing protein n=1 Tax=Actinidia chinensis var. chinensis TaxID=1590841 RepID=A0A2R6RWS0_ACTCC|nr:SH3 domain-containing protein [Actinidia chinensis var. chinensis]
MNRSFRAQESKMQAVVNQRTSMVKEKEEELALFLEMRKREKERDDLFLQNPEDFDDPLGLKQNTSPRFNITSSTTARKTATDNFLNSDNDKNDYDWLLTPPGTPLFPSLEMESQRTVMNLIGSPKARPTALKSRLANTHSEPAARNNLSSRRSASSPGLNTSTTGVNRPSSSGGPGSRPATPTGRPTLTSTSKPTLTTASKSTLTTSKPASNSVSRPSRSSTPTSRATLPSNKTTVPARSSTPLSRTTARSSTPTSRPTLPASKTTSRASTPTRRPAALSTVTNTSAPPIKSSSSAVSKPGPTTARNPVPPRTSSPTVKPRSWKPSEMPGFSLDVPPNLRTTLPDRPISATRGRPGAPSARSSSVEPVSNGRVRRQSCSPSRGRPPNGIISSSGSSVPALSRMHAKANDNVSPVLIGTKMVERVINMRKLVPPKQDDKLSPRSNLSGKSSSPDSSGFGRSLSKKSLDMAIRHMDIRRTIPGNLRPLMTNIPASSMYSVRSGPTRSRTISVSDSPLATSSNASSEVSVNNGLYVNGIEVDDDINSDKGIRSLANIRGR